MLLRSVGRVLAGTLLISVAAAGPARGQARVDHFAYDVVIVGGTVYDGSGGAPRRADVAIVSDRVVGVGDYSKAGARRVIDARGLAVAPGFINMLSHAPDSLQMDPRSQSDVRQGVTTEIFGEFSMGPLSAKMKADAIRMGDTSAVPKWNSLAEFLAYLERRGVAPNVASFVSAATVRENVIGLEDRRATAEELDRMKALVAAEMRQGALGVTSSLIYAPATYASTEELIELSRAAAPYGGMFIAHMRSEGDRFLEAVDEMIRIGREAQVPVEIYHLKASGRSNWPKLDAVISKVEQARRDGLKITADMYTYVAGATGLDSCIPPWAQSGGYDALFPRLRDPEQRRKIHAEMIVKPKDWENLCLAAGPEGLLILGVRTDALKPLIGRTVADVAKERGKDWADVVIDLVLEDRSRIGSAFFLMSEDNVKKQIKLPWVSFGSDAGSMAPEGAFLSSSQHPRAYGNFARLLGKYVRDERVITLQDAIRRFSGLPADNLKLKDRGYLKPGMFADVVVFDPATVADRATFEKPHQYSVGVRDVLVNGVPVFLGGSHTGATPGRALRGAGAVTHAFHSPSSDDALAVLAKEIERLAGDAGGPVGVSALHLDSGRRVSLRGEEPFPMASSYKVPIAVELLRRVDAGEFKLDDLYTVRPQDLHPGSGMMTGSLSKPGVALSIRNLLELMLLISDNSATDILLAKAGGGLAVTERMKAIGVDGVRVDRPTAQLIADWLGAKLPEEREWAASLWGPLFESVPEAERDAAEAAFDKDPRDTSTPDGMVELLRKIHARSLHEPRTAALLLDIMNRCETGALRLKGMLPGGTEVAHKTGTIGGTTNDVGILSLPNGAGQVAVAVFVKESKKPVAERERVIAQVARAVHDYFLFRPTR